GRLDKSVQQRRASRLREEGMEFSCPSKVRRFGQRKARQSGWRFQRHVPARLRKRIAYGEGRSDPVSAMFQRNSNKGRGPVCAGNESDRYPETWATRRARLPRD